MIPVDLNRLREALSDWRDDRLGLAGGSERLEAVADAVLDAPTVWWCVIDWMGFDDDSTCDVSHPEAACGWHVLVPVKGGQE